MPRGLRPILAIGHFVLRALPPRTASDVMAWLLARNSETFLDTPRIRANLHAAFPDLDAAAVDALTVQIAGNFGRLVSEMAHIGAYRDSARGGLIEMGSPPAPGAAIYVGAHVGAWEMLPAALSRDGCRVTAIYSRNKNPVIDDVLRRIRPKSGASYVEKAAGLRPCIEALRQGGAIALLADQRVDSGLEVDFFGRPTVVTRFPARLAMKFDCPIIPFDVIRVAPGRLRVVFSDPILPAGRSGAQVELELTQKVAAAVEGSVTRNVDSWFCHKSRWKNLPDDRRAPLSAGGEQNPFGRAPARP